MNEEKTEIFPDFNKRSWLSIESVLTVAVIASMLFVTTMMLYAWVTSSKFTLTQRNWTIVYGAIVIAVGLLSRLQRGRILILVTSVILAGFLVLNILGQHTATAWLLLSWILIVGCSTGYQTIRWLFACPTGMSLLERLIFFVSIGLGELALLTMLLGLLHLLYPAVLIAMLIVLTIPACVIGPRIQQSLVKSFSQFKQAWGASDLRFFSLVFGLFVICLLSSLLWALAPNIFHDALRYHLGVPMIYVQEHSIIDVPEEFRSYWAHSAEMLYALALTLIGQPLPSLIHFSFGVLTTGLVFALGKRIAGTRVGLIAAALFFSIPVVTWESGASYNDLVVTFFTFAAVFSVIAWWQESDDGWLPLAGVLAGLAVSTKLTAVLVLLPLLVTLACALFIRYGLSRQSAVGLLRVSFIALLPAAPWLIRDWLWSGNPVFPYLNAIFKSSKWPSENSLLNFANYGNGHGVLAFLRLPWDLTVHTSAYMEEAVTGLAGAIPLLALPWLYLLHFRRLRGLLLTMLAAATGGTILWFVIGQHLRYVLTLFPIFALLSALNLEVIWAHVRHRQFQALFVALLLAYFTGTRITHIRATSLTERKPFRVALGLETPEAFLSRVLPVYDALQYLDRQGNGIHKVLSIGNYARVYTRGRIFGIPSPSCAQWNIENLINLKGAQLKQQGFDFLLVHRGYLNAHPEIARLFSKLQSVFLRRFANPEFSSHGVSVYRLFDHELRNASLEGKNLIANNGFEELNRKEEPRKWSIYGKILVDRMGTRSHSGRVAVQADGSAWLLQLLPVKSGRLYTLGSWARSDQPDPQARLQIHWLDNNSQILDTSVGAMNVTGSWQWNELSATAPPLAALARVGVKVSGDSKVWLDDFTFNQRTTQIK